MANPILTMRPGFLREVYERGASHNSTSYVNSTTGLGWLIHRTQSANYVRTELPVRIAHRLRDMQALPYIVVTSEGMGKVYEVCASFCIADCC